MTVNTSTKQAQLRFGHEAVGQQDGVIVFDDIPVGALVYAFVRRPVELVEEILGVDDRQGYRFDSAPLPAPFTAGGVQFGRNAHEVPPYTPAGGPLSSRSRVLIAQGDGSLVKRQEVPQWGAAIVSVLPADGLRQRGKLQHSIQLPGAPGSTPDLPPEQRHLLRMRWQGTPVVAGVLGDPGGAQVLSGQWPTNHINLVPGSIEVTLPTSGGILRDDGKGRLVGADGDGTVNYLTGEFDLRFNAGETGNVTADYEHDCLYHPLDVTLTFDPIQAQ